MKRCSLKDILLETGRYLAGSEKSRIRQLRAMRQLDERLLADIGLTPADARRGYALQYSTGHAELSSRDALHAKPHALLPIGAKA